MRHSIPQILIALVFLCLNRDSAAEPLRIQSLPIRVGDAIGLDLRIREAEEGSERRLALIATFVADFGGMNLFNPVGLHGAGRPYKIVLTTPDYDILHTVIPASSGCTVAQSRESWFSMEKGAITGWCFWTKGRNRKNQQLPEYVADLPKLPAGKYQLVLLASQRLIHKPPPEVYLPLDIQQDWLKQWNDPSLDEPAFASLPVPIVIDAEGMYRTDTPDGRFPPFEALESEYKLNHRNQLSVTSRYVNPADTMLTMKGLSLFGHRDRPGHIRIERDDGAPFDRFPFPRSFSGDFMRRRTHTIGVPTGCVLGGIESDAGVLPPGQYHATTVIDDSILESKRFPFGGEALPEPGQRPIVIQSKPHAITVPEAP